MRCTSSIASRPLPKVQLSRSIDIFEYEYFSGDKPDRIQLSLHGGYAGSDATTFDTSSVGVDLRSGFHIIGFLWEAERLVWTIDGIVVKTVTDTALIPDIYSYMIVSREMNSGVRDAASAAPSDGEAVEVFPFRPRDPGPRSPGRARTRRRRRPRDS